MLHGSSSKHTQKNIILRIEAYNNVVCDNQCPLRSAEVMNKNNIKNINKSRWRVPVTDDIQSIIVGGWLDIDTHKKKE